MEWDYDCKNSDNGELITASNLYDDLGSVSNFIYYTTRTISWFIVFLTVSQFYELLMIHLYNQYKDELDDEGVVFRKREVINIDTFLRHIFVRRMFAMTLLIIAMILLSRIEVNGATAA